ncbi:Cys-Gln thioester bond-forming surface protein [Streptomyces sp. H10-C2]|uniref:Cys-Gln thioester bond-forming surface protein n=1 Tax=unclassified Streptomyces TaxID=2593676 RepID=UPI0024BAA4FD|nr:MULTISPECIES: LAETG motif-containing sortase-dependent surface protein [unclassified Streptomyces]MDJ0340068.1 Cys-Gln thioester bond-forming surface protein [Streptomyces sp. PH10-H1]MDJ0369295.1 Cys-Gln thioester bond-forming surface protein [Streptomyces sp. H10-C2]
MFKIQRRGAARLAAAGLVTGLLAAGAISGAGTASADGVTPAASGATAVLEGLQADKSDAAVISDGAAKRHVSAGLFSMAVDGGGSIQTYCIDIGNHTRPEAKYREAGWSETSLQKNPQASKINWILQHSYPQVTDLAALATASGSGPLTAKTASAGTQVAIWRLSDGAKAEAVDKSAEQLADYLAGPANTGVQEPKASLTLSPSAVSGKSGGKIGPVTVHTSADSANVSLASDAPAGVSVVDAKGQKVTKPVKNGDQLFFNVPAGSADGNTALTVAAVTQVPVGRAFVDINGTDTSHSQTQILAGSSATTVSATATANWAKKGPIPALSAKVDCAKNGVDVTASNKGDEAFTFELAGKKYTIEAGKSQTVTVPVKEDQRYEITITGPKGFSKTFKGVLDCKTAGTPTPSPTPTNQPSPASAGTTTGSTGGDLAQTGSSNATPMIAGIAVALVAVGGGAVFFLRRKKSAAGQ